MESPEPKEHQEMEILSHFRGEISGDSCAGSFLASPAAQYSAPEIQTRPG